jgi:putative membrane protein insertion efficiency factor
MTPPRTPRDTPSRWGPARRVALWPIAFYQRWLSPLKLTPTCRFVPSCSSYAVEAIARRGIAVGFVLAAWRLLRCNPLCTAGFDPVPPARSSRARRLACDHLGGEE